MFFDELLKNEKNEFIKKVLVNQKKKYDALKQKTFKNNLVNYLIDGKVFLPKDALLHGTNYDIQKFKSIKESGILSSEFAMKKYDSYQETFYMADFFKNVAGKPLSIMELLSCENNANIHYLPSLVADSQVAFIVNTDNEQIKEYLKTDLFLESNSDLYPFIDEEMYFSIERRKHLHQYNYKLGQSSIPIGVPYSALCGIIVGKKITENKNNELDEVKKIFGNELFIISCDGEILNNNQKENVEEVAC